MTVLVDFQPSPTSAFEFRATFDGTVYNCTVTWNIWGVPTGRWYINVYQLDGTRVLSVPLIGSPPANQLERITTAYPVTSMTWAATGGGLLFIVMAADVTFGIGQLINIAGATNTGSGGNSIVNGDFTINSVADATHLTLYAPAGPGVIGTISGTIIASANTNALTWSLGRVTASAGAKLPYKLGSIVQYIVNDCIPTAYNGKFNCEVISPTEFSYELSPDPGPATTLGTFGQDTNLLAGYFSTSSMIWRDANQQFEIRP